VAVAVKALNGAIAELAGSGLTAGQKEKMQIIATAASDYEKSFASYVEAAGADAATATNWKMVGEKLVASLAQADERVNRSFLLLRIAGVYYLKDRNDERWKALQAGIADLTPILNTWLASAKKGVDAAGIKTAFEEYLASAASMKTIIAKKADLDALLVTTGRAVIDNAAAVETELDNELRQTSTFAVLLILVSAGAALLLGIGIAILLTLSITRPVRKAVKFAAAISSCDFSDTLDIKQKDEMGVLAESLNDIVLRMRDMCGTIQDGAEQVSSSSAQIAASAQTLATDSQSQASALEETSAAVQQLTASVEQVAEHAQAQASSGEQGSSAISQVRVSIEEISHSLISIADLAAKSVDKSVEGADAVQKVVQAITQISSGSDKIAGIVNVISDIADQTNLLALNASIEAARAGEHGRGFAVVAEEVSKLADRSASSTKEIESLIKESVRNVNSGVAIAEGSQAAMGQIRDASQSVKSMIVELSTSMGQQVTALKELVSAIEKISEMNQSISAATEEQSVNAKEVAKAVENVSDLTQSAASAAEEMSASTEQLSAMAKQLRTLISGFKLKAIAKSASTHEGAGETVRPSLTTAAHEGNGNANVRQNPQVLSTVA
jgi:methyl-accepting chemotaxis protein